MNKIGVLFADRDFSETFVGVLEFIGIPPIFNFENKKAVADYINSIVGDCYTLYQKTEWSPDIDLSYLTINERHIYLDLEVDALLESDYFRNGEFHVLDVSNGIIDSF